MVHRNFIQSSAYAQTPKDTQVISIVGLGGDDHRVSIELPRSHHLVKHLERLIPSTEPQQTQAPPPLTHVLPPLSQYIPNNARYGTATSPFGHNGSLSAPSSPQANRSRRRRTNGGKRCQFVGCDNFSVSHGLCRRHGGGRRCQHDGCSKSAQSRSNFCWAHGGGQRCEVVSCMRSRKSKRFCAAHLDREKTTPAPAAVDPRDPVYEPPAMNSRLSNAMATGRPRLPSLLQTLRDAQSSMMVQS